MSNKQFHFVVVGEIDEAGLIRLHIDPYTEEARFPDGSVWNDETEEWEQFSDNEKDGDTISLALAEILREHNPI